MNKIPILKPSVLKEGPIIGLGYRSPWVLGNIVQAKITKKYSLNVMLAQQSARELERTKRTFSDVIESAIISAYEANLTLPWGADGDHLRKDTEVQNAAESGCAHFTYDLTDELKNNQKNVINKICRMYNLTREIRNNDFTTEISLDETDNVTKLSFIEEIFKELKKIKVKINEVAPRFPGYFEKAIDYYWKKINGKKINNTKEFSEYLVELVKLSRKYGFRISIHSGSDKFSIYHLLPKIAGRNFHLKTAGTYYLEELRVVAKNEPDFFRDIYRFSLKQFEKDRATYELSADPNKIPDLSKLNGVQLFNLLESGTGNDDLRQVLHVTYGSILTSQSSSGDYIFRDKIYSILKNNEKEYNKILSAHIERHINNLI